MKPVFLNLALTSVLVGTSLLIFNLSDTENSIALEQKEEPIVKPAIEENSSKSEGVKIYKEKFEAYKEDILGDVLTNYSELDLRDYIRIEATSSHEGLPSLLQIGKTNTEVESLIDICWEKDDVVLGEKWLFVKGDKGYFLYKTPDGSDVMRQIKRNGELWEVEKESVREGQKINWIE